MDSNIIYLIETYSYYLKPSNGMGWIVCFIDVMNSVIWFINLTGNNRGWSCLTLKTGSTTLKLIDVQVYSQNVCSIKNLW